MLSLHLLQVSLVYVNKAAAVAVTLPNFPPSLG